MGLYARKPRNYEPGYKNIKPKREGTTMETENAYQQRELLGFINSKNRFFDTVAEFSKNLEEMDILKQITWIENGSYGAGACFALQNTLNRTTPRMNAQAHIGQTVLHAFYGAPFRYWQKLSPKAQARMTKAVTKWLKKKHEFAQTLEI